MRITSSGDFQFCRWAKYTGPSKFNIWNSDVEVFFREHMQGIRDQLVQGQAPIECGDCYTMDQHGKASGRARQLLKTGIRLQYWDRTVASSPWLSEFTSRSTQQLPVDWQIDLGNHCNSACVFCVPRSSSRLATEFKKIGWIDQLPKPSWSMDDKALDKFVSVLEQTPNLAYLHFLGGETLITPGFKRILGKLIERNLLGATIGFTTNLTVWDAEAVNMLSKFKQVNLGLSIETLDSVNDYVRWPSDINCIRQNLDKWVQTAKQHGWLTSLRITPTFLTVDRLIPLFDYAIQNELAVESCNFISEPEHMSPSVLPVHLREEAINDLTKWLHGRQTTRGANVRDPNQNAEHVASEASSYLNFLSTADDNSHLLPVAAKYLRTLDDNRGNSVLDYRPDYENLLRNAGY